MFNPRKEYEIIPKQVPIRDFSAYKEEYVTRPPYQRKSVWSTKKQQALLDSLFRRYYVPRIVIREVRLDENQTVFEVIDGQQRILTVQRFMEDKLKLPESLSDLDPSMPGKHYGELSAELRRFVDRDLAYDADIVKGIGDPKNPDHQKIATEIFWRLQQGETLNYMEIAHARLSSLTRNFITKYADDITFDFDEYAPVDHNPHKHPFFTIIDRNNDRMQHLALMARFLILEDADGPADIRDKDVMEYIDKYQVHNGIGNHTFENEPPAKNALANLNALFRIFKDDPMLKDGKGRIKELRVEYFIVSVYLLLKHLRTYYVFGHREERLFRQFVISFHERWKMREEDDRDVLVFSDSRQQSVADIETRHRILRQAFFEFARVGGHQIRAKDTRRAFSEAERIAIYRRDRGLCQECIKEGKPESECVVPWKEYDADHVVPHSLGGKTIIENARVLCRYHNQKKGANLQGQSS